MTFDAQRSAGDEPATGTVIHSHDRGDRAGRLSRMGLSVDGLVTVMRAGYGGYNASTGFHPSFIRGTQLYSEATAALRRLVIPTGHWGLDEEDGQPRTFSDVYGIAIVVQTGDLNTGLVNRYEPTARNAKGWATAKKIASNHDQYVLPVVSRRDDRDGDVYVNWVFLIAVDGMAVRAELSLPREMVGGKPHGWIERIILPEIELGALVGVQAEDGDTGSSPDIDVEWKR